VKGFKDFLLRGNLIELAVAFIMGTAFALVVKSFTDIVVDLVGKIVRVDNFSNAQVAGINVGAFVSALITFVLTAAVLYFAVVVPYNKFSDLRKKEEPEKAASSEDLLAEIRDLLRDRPAAP
jgi:large conductance mechanosensitive channel